MSNIKDITPQQLHNWYLEATKELHPEFYSPNAVKPYEELTDEQKFLDKYIAEKIKSFLTHEIKALLEELVEDDLKEIREKLAELEHEQSKTPMSQM